MSWFSDILTEIFPLYLISLIGYIAGRFAQIDVKSITTLAIFVISPIVFMISISKLDFTAAAVMAPLLTYGLALVVAAVVVRVSKFYLEERTAYLLALSSGTNNWGYFGIPIAFALFPPEMVAAYIMVGFGMMLFEGSAGLYYISRGHKTPLESFKNIFRYPTLYAILVGLTLSYFHFELPHYGERFFELFKGAYTVLGMMIIGLGLSQLDRFRVDVPFTLSAFAVRFLIWPLLAIILIMFDKNIFSLLGDLYYKPLLLFSVMPLAANNIAFAAQFDMRPGKAAIAVLLSTLFALIYVPLAIWIFDL